MTTIAVKNGTFIENRRKSGAREREKRVSEANDVTLLMVMVMVMGPLNGNGTLEKGFSLPRRWEMGSSKTMPF